MSAGFKQHSELDLNKWDQLVYNDPNGNIFSTSHYLNATCDNWYAFIDERYSYGVAIGVTSKLGIKSVYPPFFHRQSELLGHDEFDKDTFEKKLLEEFKTGVLHLDKDVLRKLDSESFIYQTLSKDEYRLKNQAKRMLKKFEKTSYELTYDNSLKSKILSIIKSELSRKLDLYSSESAIGLDRLVTNLPASIELITIALKEDENLVGGLLGLKYKNTVLYLKGTTTEEAKEQGGMYGLMNALIHEAIDHNLLFDFGGSRVEGVRFFNRRFNAQDKTYFCYHWDDTPVWYKTLKQINQWRKK